jgi:putative oxidoreductase
MTLATTLIIIGRIVFGGFFLIAGIRNFIHFAERREMVTNFGWKLPPALTATGFAVQMLGGLSLILGLWIVVGALALIAFLVPATCLFHNITMFRGKERDPHLYLTLVNTTLVGGLLLVIATAI